MASAIATIPDFVRRMNDWQSTDGRHGLPWQGTGDAYRVWVSEIMLQQTQVAAVLPRYRQFIVRFPSVEALAVAPLDDVLGLWSGLGYYSRARNLHRAAQLVVAAGGLPASVEALQRLPGIGRSTAGAIVSLALDRPAAILDGNVRRVLARHAGIEGWPGTPAVANRLWAEAEARLPPAEAPSGTAATYSQALMDLGASVCLRQRPACGRCPVAEDCVAHHSGRTAALPAPRPTRQRPRRELALVLDCSPRGVVLVRRPERGVWGGLWCLPEGGQGRLWRTLRHDLTHLRLEILVVRPSPADHSRDDCLPRDAGAGCAAAAPARRVPWPEVWALGLPQPVRHLLQLAQAESGATAPALYAALAGAP